MGRRGTTHPASKPIVTHHHHHPGRPAVCLQAVAELDALKADAVSVLDKHLGKTAEQVRKEQAAALASAVRKAEAA